ncbi:STE-domain-containing protein [Punctularia strigosozonata HHB-11173 SS5]|uniref:STE-domain-containing protein n=1 Tax=Punctularia strigosozonata (strain HHB-11173) TaxID=741275 RepID=UPI00044179CF|nr:STE-domain-containing protein [Punctularia strigosozonata HHB-11173 SS5]EIN05698.1 STE-domain-containing protein [Punctularia strigosozonata HHB-11173 SS5]
MDALGLYTPGPAPQHLQNNPIHPFSHHPQHGRPSIAYGLSPAPSPPGSAPPSPPTYAYAADGQIMYQQPPAYPSSDPSSYPYAPSAPSYALQTTTAGPAPHEDVDYGMPSSSSAPAYAHAPQPPHASPSSSTSTTTPTAPPTTSAGALGMTQLTRPLTAKEQGLLAHLDKLKFFLATAPSHWDNPAASSSSITTPASSSSSSSSSSSLVPGSSSGLGPGSGSQAGHHPSLNRFLLPNQESVSCVLWSGLYHITGTDIVRALVFRFEAFGRPVRNMKKFEEGVFSDLRNLKPGVDACLEEPKSPFLDLLFKYQCIRTQKKQKVFYWSVRFQPSNLFIFLPGIDGVAHRFSVPHDRLFLDALERDLKRERMGQEPTTAVVGEPALSFTYDPKRPLYEQFSAARDGEGELEAAVRVADEAAITTTSSSASTSASTSISSSGIVNGYRRTSGTTDDAPRTTPEMDHEHSTDESLSAEEAARKQQQRQRRQGVPGGSGAAFFSMLSLFEGSPTYKQRRKKQPKSSSAHAHASSSSASGANRKFGAPFTTAARPSREGGGGGGGAEVDMGAGYGARDGDLSAADMFLAQAREEFGPRSWRERESERMRMRRKAPPPPALTGVAAANVHGRVPLAGPSSAPTSSLDMRDMAVPTLVSGPLSSSAAGGFPSSPYSPEQAQYARAQPQARHTYAAGAGYDHPHHQHQQQQPASAHAATLPASFDAIDGRAFACPLYSCGRTFRRAEHARRHMRTHTAERPHGCARCGRRFARADNLAQHARTHARADAEGVAHVDDGVYAHEPEDARADEADVDSEDEIYAQQQQQQQQQYATSFGVPSQTQAQVQGQGMVSDWVQTAFPGAAATAAAVPPAVAHLRHGSGASSSSLGSTSSPQLHYRYLSPDSGSSLSAPSTKASFDHAALYPLGQQQPSVAGPVRRFRSVTPNYARAGESIRRPLTASIPDYAGTAAAAAARAYHPYAAAYESTHSSPAHHTVPLAYAASQSQSQSQTHSRRSSGDVPMMGLQPDADPYAAAATQYATYATDSPGQYPAFHDSPPSDHEGAMQDQGMYMLGLPASQQQQQQQQQVPVVPTTNYYALAGQVESATAVRHVSM